MEDNSTQLGRNRRALTSNAGTQLGSTPTTNDLFQNDNNDAEDGYRPSEFKHFAAENVRRLYHPISSSSKRPPNSVKSKMMPLEASHKNKELDTIFDPGLSMPRAARASVSQLSNNGIKDDSSSFAEQENPNYCKATALRVNEPQRVNIDVLQVSKQFPDRKKCETSNLKMSERFFSPVAHKRQHKKWKAEALGVKSFQTSSFSNNDGSISTLPSSLSPIPTTSSLSSNMLHLEPDNREKSKGDDIDSSGYRKSMRDSKLLGEACRRAGRLESEAGAYFTQAILADNMGNFKIAISLYNKYLAICKRRKDRFGEAAACNCLGVDYHLLARLSPIDQNVSGKSKVEKEREKQRQSLLDANGAEMIEMAANSSDVFSKEKSFLSGRKKLCRKELLKRALSFHHEHNDVADDIGKCIANSNLGLVYADLGDLESAAKHHQMALKQAMVIRNLNAQAVSLGNLSIIGEMENDMNSARQCLQQQVELWRDLQLPSAESETLQKLGRFALQSGNDQEAKEIFSRALLCAKEAGCNGLYNAAKCQLGIATGRIALQDRLRMFADAMVQV
eukprot:g2571.t1